MDKRRLFGPDLQLKYIQMASNNSIFGYTISVMQYLLGALNILEFPNI